MMITGIITGCLKFCTGGLDRLIIVLVLYMDIIDLFEEISLREGNMARKLKRRRKKESKESVEETPKPVRRRRRRKAISSPEKPLKSAEEVQGAEEAYERPVITVYEKQKCQHVDSNGKKCKYNAIGKGTLCRRHGGVKHSEELVPAGKEGLVQYNNGIFNPAVHPMQYIEFSRLGLSDVEIAAQMEVALTTIQKWSEKYEVFALAYEVGKAMHESWWIQTGKDNLNDRSFNASLFKFLTMNKLGYSDKVESKSMNMNMHGVLVVPDTMSEEEWENADM